MKSSISSQEYRALYIGAQYDISLLNHPLTYTGYLNQVYNSQTVRSVAPVTQTAIPSHIL